ncbi:hypothetical protein [Candidatus Palauibacter sp.]|uniref:hypothetical protein n=1 Tax=Candidatus Palauibacter sp. TaxID=3101350 RepID=UPI003C6F936B
MRRFGATLLGAVPALALAASGAIAQELDEICPDAQLGTGALWGLVADAEAGIGLPGATVVATWENDGDAVRTEGQTALDGGYVLCHVPLGVEVAVQPIAATLGGAVVVTTLTDDFLRVDLSFTLADADGDDRLWACPDSRVDPTGRMRGLRLLRCDSDWEAFEACPREEEHGEVEAAVPLASRVMALSAAEIAALQSGRRRLDGGAGSGSGLREAIGKLVADAKRLGANALINWDREGATLTAKAVTITVDPSTCN